MMSLDEDCLEEHESEEVAPADPQSDPLAQYITSIAKKKMFSAEEEHRLATLAVQGDVDAKNKMIENYLGLVVNIAKGYAKSGMPLLDLIQEGNLGVMHAINKFDPSKGFRFATYATPWIRDYMRLFILHHKRMIRLPVKYQQKADIQPETIVSFDTPSLLDPRYTLADTIADNDNDTPCQAIEKKDMKALAASLLSQLNSTQRALIEWDFDIGHHDARDASDISKKLKVKASSVPELKRVALKRLKEIASKSIDKSQATVYI